MKKILAGLGTVAMAAAFFCALPGSDAQAQNSKARIMASDYFAAKDYPQVVKFPNGVTMTNMTYSVLRAFRPFTMEVYRPADNAVHPGLLFIHGGNWTGGNVRSEQPFGDFPGLLAAIAARGYVVTSIDYRLSGEARFPAAMQDVKTAIRFMRTHAREWNMDDTRIAAWGASVGGYMAVMAGVTCGVAAFEPPPVQPAMGPAGATVPSSGPVPSDCVQAVVDWSGLLVLDKMFTDGGKPVPATSIEGEFLGCEPAACSQELLHTANPMNFISDKSPPMLIQQGDADAQIPNKQPQDLYNALRAKNVPAELAVYHDSAHMFTTPHRVPGGSAADPVNDQAVLDKMMQFLDATFPQKK